MSNDRRLADLIEGVLDAEGAHALERELAASPRLRDRYEALQRALDDAPKLPELELPPGLRWRVQALVERHLEANERAEPRPSRAALAGALEGEPAPGLESALRDPAVRDELLNLAGALPTDLPCLEPPVGLFERVQVRLLEAGLVSDLPAALVPTDVPAGLLGATLERLEVEGLVEPSPAPLVFPVTSGGVGRRWLAAAAVLLCAVGFSAVLAYSLGREHERILHDPSPLAFTAPEPWQQPTRLDSSVREAREERDRALARVAELEEAAVSLSGQNARSVAALGSADAELKAAEVAQAEAQAVERTLRTRLTRAVAHSSELEGQLLAARESSKTARAEAADARLAERRAVLELATAEAAREDLAAKLEAAGQAPRGLLVDASRAAVRWEPGRGSWEPVAPGAQLPGGTVVRGEGRGTLVVAGRSYPLRGSSFVVSADLQLEPLPTVQHYAAARRARQAPRDLNSKVQLWASELGSGSPRVRSRAQSELLGLYERFGDPGPGMVERLLRSEESTPGVPTTARGWLLWWERVAPASEGALK